MKKLEQKKFNLKFSNAVRKLREERVMSRRALADISGVNENYIGKIERGECSASCFMIKNSALGLGTNLPELLKGH